MKQGITLFEALAFAAAQIALVALVWQGEHNHRVSPDGQSIYYIDGHTKWNPTPAAASPAWSSGWDPTKRHSADTTCAIIADRPASDTYVGAPGYDTSLTDICIRR